MASDAEWVEDVRRWYRAGKRNDEAGTLRSTPADDSAGEGFAVGYEAADPALQARYWPDAALASAEVPRNTE